MRSAFFCLIVCAFALRTAAQCPAFQLSDLQMLQKTSDAEKENWLRSHGFDLASKSGVNLRYNKCWNGYHSSKTVYNQVILWNTASGNITYLSPDQAAFQQLRTAIEERHGQTSTLGASDVFIGQMFRYNFGSQYLDGVMHWSVAIAFK